MLVVAISLAGMFLVAPASADVAPPDACQATDVGKACDNATKDGKMDRPGTCQADKCTRATPSGGMSYDCYVCKAAASATKDDGGCSTSGRAGSAALALVPLLALGLLWNRRRRASASWLE